MEKDWRSPLVIIVMAENLEPVFIKAAKSVQKNRVTSNDPRIQLTISKKLDTGTLTSKVCVMRKISRKN